MEFINGTSLESVLRNEVDAFLRTNGDEVQSVSLCKVFSQDGELFIDFSPQLDRKYSTPLPDNAIFSKNDEVLSVGRTGVFIMRNTEAGYVLSTLFRNQNRRKRN